MSTVTNNQPPQANYSKSIEQLENSLCMPVQLEGAAKCQFTILDRMAHYKVPGVSMALIDNGQIAWVKSWGVKDADKPQAVTPNTLFQAASISKPISSLAALQLVETGDLSLDKPINDYLSRWQLPENDLTQQVPVTLTHLLSHTGGVTVHGFRGYAQTDQQPTALQVLEGDEIAQSEAVIVDTLPGTNFRYSGGGSTVFQVAMEDVSNQTFTDIMDQQVLKPTGMTRSTYAQPLPVDYQDDVACGHLSDGTVVPGKWHNYPMQAPASLWTTPTDLAKFSLSVMQASRGEEGSLLSKPMCEKFLTSIKNDWGLGPRLFIKEGKTIGFHHGGANEGYRCNSVAFLDGRGAVVMTNSDVGDGLVGEILAAAAEVYEWPEHGPQQQPWIELTEDEKQQFSGVFSATLESEHYEVVVEYQEKDKGLKVSCPWLIALQSPFYLINHEDGVSHFINLHGRTFNYTHNESGKPVINILGYGFTKEKN